MRGRQRVQHVRAVRIQDALGPPRRPGSVAEAAGGVFVDTRPRGTGRRRRRRRRRRERTQGPLDELLVAEPARLFRDVVTALFVPDLLALSRDDSALVRSQADPVFDPGQFRPEPGGEAGKVSVEEDDRVPRVVGDPLQVSLKLCIG